MEGRKRKLKEEEEVEAEEDEDEVDEEGEDVDGEDEDEDGEEGGEGENDEEGGEDDEDGEDGEDDAGEDDGEEDGNGEDGGEEDEDGGKSNNTTDDEDNNTGDTVDISGDTLSLPEPPYKRDFLKKICERATQFTTLEAAGDWECWLKDLKIVLPHLTNLRKVILDIMQCGNGGVEEIVELVSKLPLVEELITNNSYEAEPMDTLIEMLRHHKNLRVLDVCFDQGNEDSVSSVVRAIREGIVGGGAPLTKFSGCELNEYLDELELDESFAEKSNEEILMHLHKLRKRAK